MEEIYENMPNPGGHRVEEAAGSGRNVMTLIFCLFGLLCITQAALNVGLRLYYGPVSSRYENASAERDELQEKYLILQSSHQKLSAEQDELKHQLHSLRSCSEHKWLFVNGSFYLGDTPALSWMESQLYCQERGADLIIINSEEEQDFVQIFGKRLWIGLSDREEEGVWRWVDGSQLTKSFWYPCEPNDNNDDEDCVEVLKDAPLNSWNDLSCGTKRHFICEREFLRN